MRKHLMIIQSDHPVFRMALYHDPTPWYIPVKTRQFLLERDNNRCRICGETRNLHIDHIKPVSKGGTCHLDNLQVLCERCNLVKSCHDLDPSSYQKGHVEVVPDGRELDKDFKRIIDDDRY